MLEAIAAHAYAGGFTVGVSKHFRVLAHLEHSGYGAEVVRLNFPGMPIYAGGPETWPDRWSPRPRFGYANPPCAIWSVSSRGARTDWRDDPRLQFHHDIFGYFVAQGLDVFAMESVTAAFTKGREHVDDLVAQAEKEGYSTVIVTHDAQHLGVPQIRKRVFMVFTKVEIDWELPAFRRVTTVAQALSRLRPRAETYDTALPRGLAALVAASKPGEHPRMTFDRLYADPPRREDGRIAGRPHFLMKRLHADKPSLVITPGSPVHPTEPRLLRRDELAALCSFPLSFKWPAGAGEQDISGYMSRGVMPKVGEWLAGNVARALEANRRINRPRAEVLDITGPPGRLYELTGEIRVVKSAQTAAPKGLPDRAEGEGSGAYIRRLLATGAPDDAILERVHAQFPGSKATKSDVSYNKAKLKKEGASAQPVAEAKAPKYAAATKAFERQMKAEGPDSLMPPWNPAKGVSVTPSAAVTALRAAVMTKCKQPALAALLNLSLDLMEKL